jgi:IS4 transposase
MSAKDIMDTYKTRFQIEFLLRDAKQFTGLTHCQSRKKNSLEFAFNMSLSTINVARTFARENNMELSMANIKTLIHNNMMLRRIIRTSGFRPNRLLNTNDFKELLFYGVAKGA